ncbi:SRPBCC family protein [Mycolicibacterium pyrenivorans]|uniref:SRPBCC family protein n=1 Tax=Mycolicibacterium pyrenivorans TaxID=187102 RepID=UPI0021F36B30|nr:SRPBCC family protein [Mycolicibacterium pyrenivorans]MCV7154096.1 SRPBCC family protein [Mycolicibacterium pyrenivorans]
MPVVSRTFNVSPPPRVIVDYLKDFAHAAQWDPGTRSCERVDRGPVVEGAYWHNVSKILGRTAELTYKLEELTDRKLVFVGENKSSTSVDTITVDAAGAGSVVTFEAEREMHGAARLLNPVMKLAFEKLAGETEKQMTTVLNQLADTA